MSTESHKSSWRKKEGSLSMSHEGARRAVERTPGARGPASTSQVPTSARRSTGRSGIVQAEGNLQEADRQREEGDKNARLHVLWLGAQPGPRLRTRGRIPDHEPEDQVQGEAAGAEQR